MKEMQKPRPWKVTPAVTIGIEEWSGWRSAMTEAMVPLSITGNAGRIHEGIIVWRRYVTELKR
jgi:hypothetical protein